MRKQYEANLLSELKKSVAYYYPKRAYWYKIPDDAKFKKPFDVFLACPDDLGIPHFYALEMKVHRHTTAFPLSKILAHQIEGLAKAAQGGYIAGVLIQVCCGSGKSKVNYIRALSVAKVQALISAGCKSMSVSDLVQGAVAKAKCKTGELLWDIPTLLRTL